MIFLDSELVLPDAPHTVPRAERLPSTRALNTFLAEAQAAVRLRGEVNVLLTSDASIRRMNRQFRGKNKATDVLSFPAEPFPGLKPSEQIAGDLAISVPTALKQAREQAHALGNEIKILILHGLLHLAGLDHEVDEGQMARRERVLRQRLGLTHGLIERAHAHAPATNAAAPAKKTAVKKSAAKKAVSAKPAPTKKTAAKKSATKSSPAKKSSVKKSTTKKTAPPARRGARP